MAGNKSIFFLHSGILRNEETTRNQFISLLYYIAQNYIAQNYIAQNYIAQNYITQNYIAQNYITQNYITQNYIAQKFCKIFKPTGPLFSGWNWVPQTLSCWTAAVKGQPYSAWAIRSFSQSKAA